MRLALDNHYSPLIAQRLREHGHDVVTVAEAGWADQDDEPLLTLCHEQGLALLTNDVADFAVIARQWGAEGRSHHGLVFTSDASLPRHRDTLGRYVELLDAFLHAHPAEDALADRIHWL